MFTLSTQALLLFTASWTLWKLCKVLFTKSPLHGLPGPPRASMITGNLSQLFDPLGIQWHHAMVRKHGGAFKIGGFFGDEHVYVTDPKALIHVLVKDQYVYGRPSSFIEQNKVVFGENLLTSLGEKHRKQRKLLNPVFSMLHMRRLTPTFYQVTHRLQEVIARNTKDGPREFDMLRWLSRTALECIGQGGLGYSFENLDENGRYNVYARVVKDFLPAMSSLIIYRDFFPHLVKVTSGRFRRFLVDYTPSRKLRKLRDIVDVMDKTSRSVFEAKKTALSQGDEAVAQQVGNGKDIMSVLLRANASAEADDYLPEDELLGQMNSLVFAAFETTSSSLARTLQLLALHPEAQMKLREEVSTARRERGDLEYDDLMALPYLDAVVRESLRLYPPVAFVARTTQQDTVLPLGRPVKSTDGKTDLHEIPLKNNTNVFLGLAAANCDPEIWGNDADVWKPQRWLGRTLDDIASARLPGVYSGMMTFSGGGRACIGFKFAELEMKIVLSVLLEQFSFGVSNKEIMWRNSGIASPITKGREHDSPHLPLIVSKVDCTMTGT